jgi:hypothetical protein
MTDLLCHLVHAHWSRFSLPKNGDSVATCSVFLERATVREIHTPHFQLETMKDW